MLDELVGALRSRVRMLHARPRVTHIIDCIIRTTNAASKRA